MMAQDHEPDPGRNPAMGGSAEDTVPVGRTPSGDESPRADPQDAGHDVELRPVLLGDVPRLAALERELFPGDPWSELMIAAELEAPGRWYVAAESEGLLVGWAGLWFDGVDAQVMTVGVTTSAQGRGIGTWLVRELIERAQDLGAARLLLEVRTDNDRAIALYERFGFTVLGVRRRYYQPEGVDAYTMQLPIPPVTIAEDDLDQGGEPDDRPDDEHDADGPADHRMGDG